MDFLSLFNNAKKIISGGKDTVTPNFDVSKIGGIQNTTPTSTSMFKAPSKFDAQAFSKSISKPFKAPRQAGINGFGLSDNSTAGIITNTITGLPEAGLNTAIDIGQGIARTVGSVGTTLGNVPTQINNAIFRPSNPEALPFDSSIDTTGNPISNAVFGGKPIKTIQQSAKDIKEGLAPYIGDKNSSFASYPLVFGGIALDLSGFGGGKSIKTFAKGEVPEAFWKFISKTTDKKVLESTFKQIGVKDTNLIKELVEVSAPTKTSKEAKTAILNAWENRVKKVGTSKPSEVPYTLAKKDEITKSLNQYNPDNPLKIDGRLDVSMTPTNEKLSTLKEISNQRELTDAETKLAQELLSREGVLSKKSISPEQIKTNIANNNRTAAILDRTTMKPATVDGELMAKAKLIIKDGKQAVVEQPRTPIGRFDYKAKSPIANITAPTTKTSSRIIPESIAPTQQKSVVDKFIDFIKKPRKQSKGMINFGAMAEDMGLGGSNKELNKIRQEALSNSPAKDLNKYFGKSSDTISQQLENYKGTDRARFIQDKVNELGYKNIDEAQTALDSYKKARTLKFSSEGIPMATPASMKGRLAKQTKQSPVDMAKQAPSRIPSTLATGEERSLERMAEQSASVEIRDPQLRKASSLPRIIEKSQTPVKVKVNALDYMRTPENVLKKIGLSKEADAVRVAYDGYVKELPKNIKKITIWHDSLSDPKKSAKTIFKWLDGQSVDLTPEEIKVANEIKPWLKEWADRQGLPEENRIANYITRLFDDQLIKKEFDEDLAKIIADKVPGSVYSPFLQKRLGAKGYKEDVWAALDAYVKRATRKVHLDPALAKLEDASRHLEESQWNYVKRYADRVNMRPTEMDNLVDNAIKSLIGYRAGQRPVAVISKMLRQTTYRGMLGLNAGSALRNLSQGINTYAKLGEKYTALGYSKLFSAANRAELEASGVLSQSFVQDRALSATKKTLEKIDKGLFYMFEKAEMINRGAAYFGAKAKGIAQGMTEEKAIEYAKKIVRETQFQFGSIDTPVAMSSDIIKTLTQFQSFTTKQIEFLGGMIKNKEIAGLIRYALAGTVFVYTIGQAFGMKPQDLLPIYRLGIPPSLKLPGTAIQAIAGGDATGKDVLNTLPGYIPAGIQAKKTIQGAQAIKEGGSYDAAGRLQFVQGQSPVAKAQALLFGKYSSSEAQDYFNRGEISKEEKAKVQPAFDQVQALAKAGQKDEAVAIFNSLSTEDKATYKKIQAVEKAKINQQGKKDILSTFNQVQSMTKNGDKEGALALYNSLNDTQKKYYKLVLDDMKRVKTASNGDKPTFDPNTTTSTNSVLDTVWAYAKALGTDPATAFNRIFTGQKIRYVSNGTIVVERMPLSESQAEKKAQGSTGSEVKLDHTIPLQLGGSNDKSNLKLVPTAIWESYTDVENTIGKALRAGKITKSKAQQLISDFKSGKITAEEVNNML